MNKQKVTTSDIEKRAIKSQINRLKANIYQVKYSGFWEEAEKKKLLKVYEPELRIKNPTT